MNFGTLHFRKLGSPSRSNCLLNKADTKRSISGEDIGNIIGAEIQEKDFKLEKDKDECYSSRRKIQLICITKPIAKFMQLKQFSYELDGS